MTVFIALSIAGIATAAAVLASRRLATAVPVLISHARQISSGDLAIGEIATDSTDEIGDLDRTFGEMVTYLQEMAAHSEAIASQEMASSIEQQAVAR